MEDSEKVAILQKMVRIKTVNGNEAVLAKYVQTVLAAHQISSRLIPFAPGRANLVAAFGPGHGPVLAFSGHLDTVAIGDPTSWQRPPFSGDLVDGTVYGRGSVDMKGGLAALVIAACELHDAGLPHRGQVKLLITVDEEVGGQGSQELTDQGELDDVDAVVIGESTGGDVEYAHCGSFDYEVESRGKMAHSSAPASGLNAVAKLADFIFAERQAFADAEASPVLGPVIHTVTVFHGGDQLNTIPDYAYLKGNVRTVPECDNAATQQRLQAIIDRLNAKGARLTLRVVASFAPVVTAPDDPFIAQVHQAAVRAGFTHSQVKVSHGATDASRFVLAGHPLSFVEFGPGDEGLAHQVDEAVDVTSYLRSITAYQDLAQQYLN